MYICVCVYVHVWVCTCVYVYMCTCVHVLWGGWSLYSKVYTYTHTPHIHVHMCVYMYTCGYVRVCTCVYVCVCVHVYMYCEGGCEYQYVYCRLQQTRQLRATIHQRREIKMTHLIQVTNWLEKSLVLRRTLMSASITRRSSWEWVWQFTATVIRRSWHCLPSYVGRL